VEEARRNGYNKKNIKTVKIDIDSVNMCWESRLSAETPSARTAGSFSFFDKVRTELILQRYRGKTVSAESRSDGHV